MNLDLFPFFILALPLLVTVIVLALWRKVVSRQEDDTLHVLAGRDVISHQVTVAHKVELIDRWGQIMTVIAAVYSAALVAFYLYQHWVRTSTIMP
jgi:cytochrome c biogenesis factor